MNVDAVSWHVGLGGGATLRMQSQRGVNQRTWPTGLVIPTLKSGPSDTLRFKRSAVSGPPLRRGGFWGRKGVGFSLTLASSQTPCPPSLPHARMRLEPLGTAQPHALLDERPR